MGKVICPEPGVQMTIGSTTIPTWRERVSTYKTPTIQEEIAARDFEINDLRAALAIAENAVSLLIRSSKDAP